MPSASVAARTEAVEEGAEDEDEAVALDESDIELESSVGVGRSVIEERMSLDDGRTDVADMLTDVIDGSSDESVIEGRSEDSMLDMSLDERGRLEERGRLDGRLDERGRLEVLATPLESGVEKLENVLAGSSAF